MSSAPCRGTFHWSSERPPIPFLECRELGDDDLGRRVRDEVATALDDPVPEALYRFYQSYQAATYARVTIEHTDDDRLGTVETRRARICGCWSP